MCSEEVQGRSDGNDEIERFAIVGVGGDAVALNGFWIAGCSCLRLFWYVAERNLRVLKRWSVVGRCQNSRKLEGRKSRHCLQTAATLVGNSNHKPYPTLTRDYSSNCSRLHSNIPLSVSVAEIQ